MKFMKKESLAIVPGSFDPMTNGHLDIIRRAALTFDRVCVAVMINDQKQYMFSMAEREEIAKACISEIKNAYVISSDGWLWKLAKNLGASAIVKGYRNTEDLEYEKEMAKFNSEHYPEAETILLLSKEEFSALSSTVVREKILNGESLEGFVPKKAIQVIEKMRT